MRVGLFGVLALLALAGPLGCVAPLPPTPTYLKFATFSSHPQRCPTTAPAWISHEWWWQDDEGTRTVQPLGHAVQSGCYPYNRVLDRKGVYQITTLQHKNPTVFRDQQIRLRKPDGNFIKKMVALPACADIHLPDNGAVGCGYNYYRPGLTPQLCKLGKGSVAKVHALSSTDPAATRIDCRYADATPYDTSTAPASGNVQLHVLNNYIAYPNVVQQYNRTGDPYYISDKALNGKTIQLTSMLPVAIPDRTGYKCGDGTSCNWSEDELFQIGTQTWTGERTVLAKGGPFFLIPVGGKWWMRMTATVFENAAGRTINKRHLIIFDDDIRQGEKGTVWRNKTGEMDHEHVELDLKAGGDLSPGWHRLTVQGRATDLYSRAVDTATMSTYLEVVPPCPTSSAVPFATHVTSEEIGKLTVRDGVWTKAAPRSESFILQNSKATDFLNYWTLNFDLSFLSDSASIAEASLYIFLAAANTDSQSMPSLSLEVFDGTKKFAEGCQASCSADTNGVTCFKCSPNMAAVGQAPCVAPVCDGDKIGDGSFKGSDTKLFVKLDLTASHVRTFVGAGKGLMPLTVVMPRQRSSPLDGASLQTLVGGSPAFLVMRGSCSAAN